MQFSYFPKIVIDYIPAACSTSQFSQIVLSLAAIPRFGAREDILTANSTWIEPHTSRDSPAWR